MRAGLLAQCILALAAPVATTAPTDHAVRVVFVDVSPAGLSAVVKTMAEMLPNVHAMVVVHGSGTQLTSMARQVVDAHHVLAVQQCEAGEQTYSELVRAGFHPQAAVDFSCRCAGNVPLETIRDVQDVHPRRADGSWDVDAHLHGGYVAVRADSASAVLSGVRCLMGRAAFDNVQITSVNTAAVHTPVPSQTASTRCPYTATKRFVGSVCGRVCIALFAILAALATCLICIRRHRAARLSKVSICNV